jgi:hypothetical protein
MFLGVKRGQRVRQTTSLPTVSPLSRKCEILDVWQLYRPTGHVTRVVLFFYFLPNIRARLSAEYGYSFFHANACNSGTMFHTLYPKSQMPMWIIRKTITWSLLKVKSYPSDLNGCAVKGMKYLRSYKPWDSGFETYSRHWYLFAFILPLCCSVYVVS